MAVIRNKIILLVTFLAAVSSYGAGASYPSAPVPAARFASGISYDYGGGYLFSRVVPVPVFSLYGINAFGTYGLADYINIGADLGLKDVNIHSSDPNRSFNGRMGIAAGPHLKLATPYLGDVFAVVAFTRTHWFYSEDKGRYIYYKGLDFTGSGAFSFHVKDFGYISMGVKYSEIFGNYGIVEYPGLDERTWTNAGNIGGWVAFDYFPKTGVKNYLPFISFELGFFPNSSEVLGKKPVFRNISFSVTVGGITNRLYGDSGASWRP